MEQRLADLFIPSNPLVLPVAVKKKLEREERGSSRLAQKKGKKKMKNRKKNTDSNSSSKPSRAFRQHAAN